MPLAIVILAVADVSRSTAFYRAALGATPVVTAPVYVELELGGGTRLGLYERVAFGRNPGRLPAARSTGEISSTELYLRVPSLDVAIAALEAAGAELLDAVQLRAWGDRAAYYADPDGNVIAVAAPA